LILSRFGFDPAKPEATGLGLFSPGGGFAVPAPTIYSDRKVNPGEGERR